ncbi:hypothetical protein [Comamonas sp. JC664]|uniref:hypothetical protein n=1 Tax=Comamonas sp. JC664 TaxID=2801917 RepID=UPI0036160165
MASEFNKPKGVSIVLESDLQTMIWPLACRKINGVGPKADAKLQALGITQWAIWPPRTLPWLVAHFGRSYGAWLHASSWGGTAGPW